MMKHVGWSPWGTSYICSPKARQPDAPVWCSCLVLLPGAPAGSSLGGMYCPCSGVEGSFRAWGTTKADTSLSAW